MDFSKYALEIDFYLQQKLKIDNKDFAPMINMIRYFLGWINEKNEKLDDPKLRGKRFRSGLLLAITEGISGDVKRFLPAASCIEMFHNFTLVHDDIEDHDEFRRHRPTVWKLWGIEQAINTGDLMAFLSQIILIDIFQNLTKEEIIETCKIINNCFCDIIRGQYLDISYEKRETISESEYFKMIKLKTARLIETACYLGAKLSSKNLETVQNIKSFGFNLGMAFQIYDDIEGIFADKLQTGKDDAGDLRKKKKTLPVIYFLENSNNENKKKFLKLYNKKNLNDYDIRNLIKILENSGSLEYSKNLFSTYLKKSLNYLQKTKKENKNYLEIQKYIANILK